MVVSNTSERTLGSNRPSYWDLSEWSLHVFQVLWLPPTIQKDTVCGVRLTGDYAENALQKRPLGSAQKVFFCINMQTNFNSIQ